MSVTAPDELSNLAIKITFVQKFNASKFVNNSNDNSKPNQANRKNNYTDKKNVSLKRKNTV